MERIGETLGAIRLQRKLSLRDVEERGRALPRKRVTTLIEFLLAGLDAWKKGHMDSR